MQFLYRIEIDKGNHVFVNREERYAGFEIILCMMMTKDLNEWMNKIKIII